MISVVPIQKLGIPRPAVLVKRMTWSMSLPGCVAASAANGTAMSTDRTAPPVSRLSVTGTRVAINDVTDDW